MSVPHVPGGGGATRAYHVLSALCDVADVTLVCPGSVVGHSAISGDLASRCFRVVESSPSGDAAAQSRTRGSRLRSWLRLAALLAHPSRKNWGDFFNNYLQHAMADQRQNRRPRIVGRLLTCWWNWLAKYSELPPVQVLFLSGCWQTCERAVEELLDTTEFDLLWCEDSLAYGFAEKLHRRFRNWVLMANSYNIEFKLCERLRDAAEHRSAADHWNSQIDCCRRLEKKVFSRAALTIVCSDADAQTAKQFCPQGNFVVIGNGVDTSYFSKRPAAPESCQPVLLFTGAFGYQPNADAVMHLLKNILPVVRLTCPDCRFVFAGRAAQGVFQKLVLADPLVSAIDSPEDMRPIFESATVFVVPLLSGGGTRLKILEAMAMQLPIVSTAIGAEGLDCRPGEHLLIADNDRAFAEAVVGLLQDEQRRRAMGAAARDWVCSKMDWNIHRERLKRVALDYARAKTIAAES